MSRAISLTAARNAGLTLDYVFDPPEGEWAGRLIAKAWGKKRNLICFFEDMSNGEKFQLNAYGVNGIYSSRDGEIDFSEPGIEGGAFLLTTGKNGKGKPAWFASKRIADGCANA